MSQLADFLKAREPLFDHMLSELEERTGYQSIDVALTAEILEKSHAAMRALGLKLDCTGRELYERLVHEVKQHDAHLARTIGGTDPDDVVEMLPLIACRAEQLDMPRDGFFLKEQVAEQMLVATPPPQIMERLGYDTVQAMMASENIYEIFLALRFAEDIDWLNTFDSHYQKLKGSDFTLRPIRIVRFDPEKWGDIAVHFIEKKFHNITHSKEMGAVAIMPLLQKRMRGITLKDLPLIIHYFNEVRLYSSFFKLMADKRNFGEIVATTLIADPPHARVVVGNKIHWRVIQRYFGKHPQGHPEIFEPHVQPEDLHWRKAEHVLYEIDPELGFWRDMDYVASMKAEGPVTFALMDVSLSYSNELRYDDRYLYHFRESLWNEVFARYLGQKTLEQQVLTKLDNDVIKPEELHV
jgi:hypothetical protein